MINSLADLLGKNWRLVGAVYLIPALIFGVGHMHYQGVRGLFTTGIIGVSLGCLFLAYKRNVWPLMIARAGVNSLVLLSSICGATPYKSVRQARVNHLLCEQNQTLAQRLKSL